MNKEPTVLNALRSRRWSNFSLAIVGTGILGYFFGSLSVWKDRLALIAYPAEDFGRPVTYPEGFWLEGALLFVIVSASASLLSMAVRRVIVTIDGYDNPKGSRQLRIWGYLITGFGVASMFINPSMGTLIFITGMSCLVVSIQQKCPNHSHLLES